MLAQPVAREKAWTEADLAALPDDGNQHELVNGDLTMSPKHNWQHGEICSRLLVALKTHADQQRLGAVWDSSTGFWMANRNCRAPDVSFVRKERLRGLKTSEARFFEGAPDLAVEVLAPSNNRQEVTERLRDFFASGTQIAWVIDPVTQTAEICLSPSQRRAVPATGFLEAPALLPGFRYALADVFAEWQW